MSHDRSGATAPPLPAAEKISHSRFYGEYNGHKKRHLEILLPQLRATTDGLIWTAGDSSLDNKYWFHETEPAEGAYRAVLEPPISKCDITYWLNHLASRQNDGDDNKSDDANMRRWKWGAINTAVEATTLNQRTFHLLKQDCVIRDNIQPQDVLVVSVGGNDIALAPAPCTVAAMAGLICCLPSPVIERGVTCGAVPVNDCCCGCGPSLLSCFGSFPPCLGYFRHLFGTRVQKYVERLVSRTKPSKVLVCMIYYLDETPTPSWASPALKAMGYDGNPAKLQLIIRKMFVEATSRISIPGTEVVPVPLFNVLDGKNTADYVARVEPSASGGRKMAEFLLDVINKGGGGSMVAAPASPSAGDMLRG